jgi:hypothetical protein
MASQKRNHDDGTIAEVRSRDQHPGHTPGGRHDIPGRPAAGGGYRHICMKIDAAVGAPADAAAALDDLARIGLSRAWLDVAQAIGYEAFMTAWQILAGPSGAWMSAAASWCLCLVGLIRYRRNQLVRVDGCRRRERCRDHRRCQANFRRNSQRTHGAAPGRQVRVKAMTARRPSSTRA